MKKIALENLLVKNKFDIKKANTLYKGKISKEEGEKILVEEKNRLYELQELLYADSSQSLLVVIQAMDAAGKDSLIEHVFGGVNPQGCEVTSFKTPSTKEYGHDFLWRNYQALPEKGKIGIFNRSHYESVLVCKVHPEYNLSEKVWDNVEQINDKFWKNRYESIRDFEKHLSRNGTKIIKLFLHVSKDEQKKRFLDRLDEKDKNWKFSVGDLKERKLWDNYMQSYQQAIIETSTEDCPWYVIPADQKWYTRLAAINIIIKALEKMDLKYPEVNKEEQIALKQAKESLLSEK